MKGRTEISGSGIPATKKLLLHIREQRLARNPKQAKHPKHPLVARYKTANVQGGGNPSGMLMPDLTQEVSPEGGWPRKNRNLQPFITQLSSTGIIGLLGGMRRFELIQSWHLAVARRWEDDGSRLRPMTLMGVTEETNECVIFDEVAFIPYFCHPIWFCPSPHRVFCFLGLILGSHTVCT